MRKTPGVPCDLRVGMEATTAQKVIGAGSGRSGVEADRVGHLVGSVVGSVAGCGRVWPGVAGLAALQLFSKGLSGLWLIRPSAARTTHHPVRV